MLHSKVLTLIATKSIHKIDTYDFDGFSKCFSLGYTSHSLYYVFLSEKFYNITVSKKKNKSVWKSFPQICYTELYNFNHDQIIWKFTILWIKIQFYSTQNCRHCLLDTLVRHTKTFFLISFRAHHKIFRWHWPYAQWQNCFLITLNYGCSDHLKRCH